MIADKIKELTAAKFKVAELEATIASELAALPASYGFESVDTFIKAVRAASGKRRGRKPGAAKSASAKAAPKARKRAKITDETRAEVKKLVEAGKTGSEIAKAVGISLPSVQNVKKQLGLVGKKK
jgi:hypothetical protein